LERSQRLEEGRRTYTTEAWDFVVLNRALRSNPMNGSNLALKRSVYGKLHFVSPPSPEYRKMNK
jgi:hypothetical protein